MDEIIKASVRTEVLLLSATPVNNDLKDLRNQLYFLIGGSDMAFAETLGVGSLKETLAAAQHGNRMCWLCSIHGCWIILSNRPARHSVEVTLLLAGNTLSHSPSAP